MPELLDNRLTITGDPDMLDRLAEELDDGQGNPFELTQLAPLQAQDERSLEAQDERLALWGSDRLFAAERSRPDPETLVYTFESAYSPPRTALELLALRYEGLRFALVWADWGSVTVGVTVYDGWLGRSDTLACTPAERVRLLRASGWETMAEAWLDERASASGCPC